MGVVIHAQTTVKHVHQRPTVRCARRGSSVQSVRRNVTPNVQGHVTSSTDTVHMVVLTEHIQLTTTRVNPARIIVFCAKRCRNVFCIRKMPVDYRAMEIARTATELQDNARNAIPHGPNTMHSIRRTMIMTTLQQM